MVTSWFVLIGAALAGSMAALLAGRRRDSRSPRVVCLMYHRIQPREVYERQKGTERIFTLPMDQFEEQVLYLKESGHRFLMPDEVRRFAEGKLELDRPGVMLTFDDGCVSVNEVARPVLERHGACGVSFVTTDPQSYVFGLGEGGDRRMTDDELRAIDGPVIRVESHAVTHRPLRGMSEDEIRQELLGSRSELERLVGRPVEYFSVPGNWHDRQVMTLAREVGYRAVWYSHPGTVRVGSGLFGLPRVNVEGQATLPQFIALLQPWGITRRRLLSSIKWVPSRLLGPRYWLPVRKVLMRCIPGHYLSPRRLLAAMIVFFLFGLAALIALIF
jgi:peptidoglycan/xylan/chitin deacetylase (PgdA/CDA1 family)